MSGSATQRNENAGGDREFAFSLKDFKHIARIAYEEAGLHMTESKAPLVYSRLAKRLRRLGIANFEAYRALIDTEAGRGERVEMIAALTTNFTKFFREPHHFEHARAHVIAPAAAKLRAGGKLRLWSAACSTGQEPYSLAMTLLDEIPQAGNLDIKILATDIDANVRRYAVEGEYNEEAVSSIPPAFRSRFLTKASGVNGPVWRVNDDVRKLVAFRELNLIGDWPMKGAFQAIFCRNVVIYFDQQTQDRIWPRFRKCLAPDGRLYIGHSERVSDPAFAGDGLTTYKIKPGAAK